MRLNWEGDKPATIMNATTTATRPHKNMQVNQRTCDSSRAAGNRAGGKLGSVQERQWQTAGRIRPCSCDYPRCMQHPRLFLSYTRHKARVRQPAARCLQPSALLRVSPRVRSLRVIREFICIASQRHQRGSREPRPIREDNKRAPLWWFGGHRPRNYKQQITTKRSSWRGGALCRHQPRGTAQRQSVPTRSNAVVVFPPRHLLPSFGFEEARFSTQSLWNTCVLQPTTTCILNHVNANLS